MCRFKLAFPFLLTSSLAWAQEDPEAPASLDIDDIMAEIDLGGGSDEVSMTYEGSLSDSAPDFAEGKPVSITHYRGNIEVLCSDRAGLNARLTYMVEGTREGPMESTGKGMGLSTWGSASSGGVKTRVPSRPSGVTEVTANLVVNLPQDVRITVNAGGGWVQVVGCSGQLRVSSGGGGISATGLYTNFSLSASKDDVALHLHEDSVLTGSNRISAPSGNIELLLPLAFEGKIYAKGATVMVEHTVDGTNTETLVQGTVGNGKASLAVTGKKGVEIRTP